MHKNGVIFFFTLKCGFSASPEVSDLAKTGPWFSASQHTAKANTPAKYRPSLPPTPNTCSLQTPTPWPTAPHCFSTHRHTLSVIYVYLKIRKAGTSCHCVHTKNGETSEVEFATCSPQLACLSHYDLPWGPSSEWPRDGPIPTAYLETTVPDAPAIFFSSIALDVWMS